MIRRRASGSSRSASAVAGLRVGAGSASRAAVCSGRGRSADPHLVDDGGVPGHRREWVVADAFGCEPEAGAPADQDETGRVCDASIDGRPGLRALILTVALRFPGSLQVTRGDKSGLNLEDEVLGGNIVSRPR